MCYQASQDGPGRDKTIRAMWRSRQIEIGPLGVTRVTRVTRHSNAEGHVTFKA